MSLEEIITKALCKANGTKQCAALCLQNLPSYAQGECPDRHTVWQRQAKAVADAISTEYVRP